MKTVPTTLPLHFSSTFTWRDFIKHWGTCIFCENIFYSVSAFFSVVTNLNKNYENKIEVSASTSVSVLQAYSYKIWSILFLWTVSIFHLLPFLLRNLVVIFGYGELPSKKALNKLSSKKTFFQLLSDIVVWKCWFYIIVY